MKLELDRSLYGAVSPALRDRLFSFVDRAELKQAPSGRFVWEYLDYPPAGRAGRTTAEGLSDRGPSSIPVVFFSGGAKLPVYSFAVIEALGQSNRVIAVAQPPCLTLSEHFAGVEEVMRREGVVGFHTAGSSWGGCLAQVAALEYPDRVRKMILSSTGLAGGKAVSLMLRLHLASVRRADPAKVVAGFRKRALGLLAGDAESGALWEALFGDVFDRRFTHEDYVSLIGSQLDYVDRYAARVAGQTWDRPVLILVAKNESAGNAGWRAALMRAYPAAQFHLFEAGGHHPALQHAGEYRRIVAEFLAQG